MTISPNVEVSVIIPLYNKEASIKRAVYSVLSQTFQSFEIIIINDGSTDNGLEIVRGINDNRIKIIEQKNSGVSAARNRGIMEAVSDLIAFLDADDEWMPDFLKTIIYLRNKYLSCDVFATYYFFKDFNNKIRYPMISKLPFNNDGIIDNYFQVAASSDPPLWTSAVAVNRKAIITIGMFPVGVISGEDLITWGKLALKYKIAYSKIPNAIYHISGLHQVNIKIREDVLYKYKFSIEFVAQELEKLLDIAELHDLEGIKSYIGLYYKMCFINYLQIFDKRGIIKSFKKMTFYTNKYLYLFYPLILHCPMIVLNLLLKYIRIIKDKVSQLHIGFMTFIGHDT